MKNSLLKTTVALLIISALTTQTVAAPFSSKPQMQMSLIKPLPFDTIPARGGVIKITPILHASIQIEYRGKVILVDPIGAGNYTKQADLILITHSHADHFDMSGIYNAKPGAPIVAPRRLTFPARSPKISTGYRPEFLWLSNRQQRVIAGVRIEAVPAYNIKRGPKSGAKYHPKGDGNGYILTIGGKRIYIAGDTEATPEMKALKNIDAAFIPMNLPYTMTPQEAAIGVRAFKPKVVYPYHFRYPFNQPNSNPQQFIKAMKGSGVQVRVLDWYNAAPVARFMNAAKND